MKKINFIAGGGYSAPIVDILTVSVENGFAASSYNPTEGTEQPDVDLTPEEL